jgi:integrase
LTLQRFAVEHYLPHARLNKRSWRTDEAILRNHLLPALGTLRLDQIRSQDVRALQHRMVIDGAAAGSVNRRLVLLAHLFACAARWALIDEGVNPVRAVEALPDHGARERFLSPEESHRLLLELVAEPNRGVANLVLLLMLTGARRSEIALARWPDVDLDRRLLRVPLSKSGKPRHIVLSQAAVDCIRALPRKPGCDWLLPNPRSGRPLTGVFEVWARVRERAGLPGLRLHDLRHSYASFLVNAGRSLYEVQALLGHANPRTTMRYAHLSQATLRDAADQVGRILAMSSPSNAPPLTTVPH